MASQGEADPSSAAANNEDGTRVQVFVYDLSRGMMRSMSQAFLGKQLEGLWHTSVVAYGREWFFGGGIQSAAPRTTAAGHPIEVLDYGETEIPAWLFEQFLHDIQERFTPEKYHLMENNCNTFAHEVTSFLVGRGLPHHIINLPSEVMTTPLGAMLMPMIDSFFGNAGGSAAPV